MKKYIKFSSILFALLLVLSQITVFAKTVSVYDESGVLLQEELISLEKLYDGIRDNYNIDVAFAITDEFYSDTAMESADDFYDEKGYGMGKGDDGILLYISKEQREYHITTHGSALTAFNDNGIRYIQEKIVPHLKEDDYYKAVYTFAETCEELLEMYANGEPYNEKPKKNVVIPVLIAIGVSLLIALVKTSKKLSQMKTANKQTYANNYIKPGSMNIAFSRDIFLYSHTDRREIPKSDSGSSSSSSHTSSSGRTHGGGGGSF